MKRKSIFWASVSLAVVLAYSCRLPSTVQVNADNFELSVRLSAEASFSAMFMDILEDAFDGGEAPVRVFDMVDVGPAMTFLAAFELDDMLPSFNPGDYLADFASYDAEGITSINHSVPAPQLSWSPGGIPIPINDLLPGVPSVGPTPIRVPLPQQVVDAIKAAYDDVSGGFLNADVGSGSVSLGAAFRAAGSGHTVALGVSGRIAVSQAPAFLGGESFPGLGGSWVFHQAGMPHNLQDSRLNGKPIEVNTDISESYLYIGFGGHNLVGGTVYIDLGIDIRELRLVRWDPNSDDFMIPPVEVDFAAMHGRRMSIADFIREITLSETKMSLDVSRLHPALDNNVELAVTSDMLGFDGEQELLASRGTTFTGSRGVTLEFGELWIGDEAIAEIKVELVPPNGRFFELGPINLDGNGGLYIYASVGLGFEWYSAKIDIDLIDPDILSGSILEEPINLGDTLGDLMNGFAFADGSIGLSVFLDGAPAILDIISPMFTLNAVLDEGGDDKVPLFEDEYLIEGDIPMLPDGTSWAGELPSGGLVANMDNFIRRIGGMLPEYLRLSYEVTFDDRIIPIYRYMFDDGGGEEEEEVRLMVMMKLALDFNVSANASFDLPLFEGENDIFGRDYLGDPLFGDDSIDLRMLMLRLDFDDSIFRGAVLHLDANGRLFPGGLPLNHGDNDHLEVRIAGNDFDIINNNLIPPDVRIVYPQARNLTITRNLMPTRIAIAISGSYRLEF